MYVNGSMHVPRLPAKMPFSCIFYCTLPVPEEVFKNESSLQPPHRQIIQKSTMIIRKRKRK